MNRAATKTEFSERLSLLLASKGISQRELARRSGAKTSTVNNWFLGKQEPSASDLAKIAQITGCSLNWLILGYEQAEQNPPYEIVKASQELDNFLSRYKNQCDKSNTVKLLEGDGMFSDLLNQAIDSHGGTEELSSYLCGRISSDRLEDLACGAEPSKQECNVLSGVLGHSSGELLGMVNQYKSNGRR
jgi:transcriptional regulator with XRE-family HTH domain